MSTYVYSKLEAEDIRLLTLLPGGFDEALRLSISHVTLIVPGKDYRARTHPPEHQKCLPSGWIASFTLEGRAIYDYTSPDNRDQDFMSWTHPNPSCCLEDKFYLPDDPVLPDNKPHYDALSYTCKS